MTNPKQTFKVGRYTLHEKLGVGGFGIVRKAVNDEDGTVVAIKILDKTELHLHDMTQHVKKEITLLTILKHPNIVRGYEVLNSKSKLFLVMEYVDGGDMHTALTSKKKFSEEEAQALFTSLIQCLHHCHEQGIYHRDLKLENLLLTSTGQLKVCDFGLASVRALNSGASDLCQTIVGTEDFSPPEMLQNIPYRGDKADMWSAGILLYTMIAGYCPFQGRSPRELHQKIISCKFSFPRDFPEQPKKIVSKLLVSRENDRLSAAEVLEFEWITPQKEKPKVFEEHGRREPRKGNTSLVKAPAMPPSPTLPPTSPPMSRKSRGAKQKRHLSVGSSLHFSGIQNISGNYEESVTSPHGSWETPINAAYSSLARANVPGFTILFDAMRQEQTGVPVLDRRWRLKTFARCCVGTELVSWLSSHLSCSREVAVEVGQKLLNAGVFHHVCRDHDFKDEFLFYRFLDDEPENALVLNLRIAWRRSVLSPNPTAVAFTLLNRFLSICRIHQALHDYRTVNITRVQRDTLFERFLSEVCELQVVDIDSLLSDDQRISFLVNVYNLFWLQARTHVGDFEKMDNDTLLTTVKSFQYVIGGIQISLSDIEQTLFGSRSVSTLSSASSSSEQSDRKLSGWSNTGQSVFSRLLTGRKRAQKICKLLKPQRVDPLVHFIISDSSPQSPIIRGVREKEINSIFLRKAAAEYLDLVLELDTAACIVTYPEKVRQFREAASVDDDDEFIELAARLCTGQSVEPKLRKIQALSLEQNTSVLIVVKHESSMPYSFMSFSPRIGAPVPSESGASASPWMAGTE